MKADVADTPVARAAPRRRRAACWTAGFLLAATLLVHGWSLTDGAVLDDHWHQHQLRKLGWSPGELLRALEIEPARWVHFWWQDRSVRWEYFRPLFTLAMKVCYNGIGGNDPWPLHAFSILLHATSAWLIVRLGRRLGLGSLAAAAAGLVFVVYPHALMTVAWSSSLNVVLATTLSLAALLAYWHASDLTSSPRAGEPPAALPLRRGWCGAALLLWLAALATRENAVLLPVVFVALDRAFGGAGQLRARRPLYVLIGILAVAFVALRIAVIDHPMPGVYIRRPAGDLLEYASWAAVKLLHYGTAAVWFAPLAIGPTGRYAPLREVPLDVLLMAGIVALVGLTYWRLTRDHAGWWIWPLWIVLMVLPVVPVIATPHSGYLPGVGVALGLGLVADAARSAPAMRRRVLGRSVVVGYLCVAAAFAVLNRWQWTAISAAERLVHDWVAARPPGPAVEHVFFVNLPFVNIYAKPALDHRLGPAFADTRCHVLAFSPDPFLFEQRCTVRPLDSHTFELRIAGRPYFAGLLGRFLLDGFSTRGRLKAGARIDTPEFTAEVMDADAEGVRALRFRFRRPLADVAYRFYLTSAPCGAAPLHFPTPADERPPAEPVRDENELARTAAALRAGEARAGDALLAASADAHHPLRRAAMAEARPVVAFVADATGGPALPADEDVAAWGAFARWWRACVTDAVLADTWQLREAFARWIKQREEVPHARMWAGKVIRTDLYLTGPPFPGPH